MTFQFQPGKRYRVTFLDDICVEFLYVGLNPATGQRDIEVPPGSTDPLTWEEFVTGPYLDLHEAE